jgi:FAD/FMN-containing dehydrogenase
MDLKELQSRVTGTITIASDSHYERMRRAMVWNRLVPERRPRIIVQAANENAVVEAVRFARANKLKVAVRGGGHSWVGFSLRDDSLLIDVGRLKNISIDGDACVAVIQPAVRSRDFNRALVAQNLAFPVGHCATVPMSGFLLNGALGWNYNAWGPGCFSIEAARVVTADGDLVVTSEKENADLRWALRGAGPGFFAIVTEYTLRVYSAPQAITTSNYYYPLPLSEEVAAWGAGIARELPRQAELTIFVAAAPPTIASCCDASNGLACIVSGTAFVDSASEAASMLDVLDGCPVIGDCLLKESNLPTPIDALHDISATLWPEDHRYLADTLWTNSPQKVLATAAEHLLHRPSPKSFLILVFSTGPEREAFPDGAFSMTADACALCYGIWERPEDDVVNTVWHRATIAALDEFAVGHYIGESDIVADPRRAERSYSKQNWERLKTLRDKYDPDRLFNGFDES